MDKFNKFFLPKKFKSKFDDKDLITVAESEVRIIFILIVFAEFFLIVSFVQMTIFTTEWISSVIPKANSHAYNYVMLQNQGNYVCFQHALTIMNSPRNGVLIIWLSVQLNPKIGSFC